VERLQFLLGLPENALRETVESTYKTLMKSLDAKNFPPDSQASEQAARCRRVLEKYHLQMRDGVSSGVTEEDIFGSSNQTRPRLGQLCVSSGMISMQQLQEAVETQAKEGRQLGEILQAKQFISQAELDGLLLGQQIIDMPSACTDPFGKRLVLLDLATEEMILIAQMEQNATGYTVGELVARHGWVAPEVVRVLGAPVAS